MYNGHEQDGYASGLRLGKRKDNYYEEEDGRIWRRSREGRFDIFSSLNFLGEVGRELIIWPD